MDFLLQNTTWTWLAIALASGALLFWETRKLQANALNPAKATLLINRQDAIVIDVREPGEYAAGHIPQSRSIPLGQLPQRLGELERFKEKPVIVVCQKGMRATGACGTLIKNGFSQAQILSGGIVAWEKDGLPITRK